MVSPAHLLLNKAFREFYKLTPGQYRRQFKESAANTGNVPESLANSCLNSAAHTALSKPPIAYPAYEGFTAELTLIANAEPERIARNSCSLPPFRLLWHFFIAARPMAYGCKYGNGFRLQARQVSEAFFKPGPAQPFFVMPEFIIFFS